MFRPLRERLLRLHAEWIPPRLAYYVALRVLAHSACTAHAGTPAEDIRAMDALEDWSDLMIHREPLRRALNAADDAIRTRETGRPILDEDELERLTAPLGPV